MILLRHGQSEFNLHFTATRRDPGIKDPVLTPLGQQQAEAAAQALANQDIRRIIASPYTRALQTAAPIASKLGLTVTVTPLVRERYAFTCDIGTHRSILAEAWPGHALDHIEDRWWPTETESEAAILARARHFRASMREEADWPHTLVVSHWGFILSLTGQSVMNGQWLRCDPHEDGPETVRWNH